MWLQVFITTEGDNAAVLVGGDGEGEGGAEGEVVQTEYIVEDEHGNKYSAGTKYWLHVTYTSKRLREHSIGI